VLGAPNPGNCADGSAALRLAQRDARGVREFLRAVGFLFVLLTGPGRWSLDARLAKP